MAGAQQELAGVTVQRLVALIQVAAFIIHLLRDVQFNAAEGVDQLHKHFQADGHIAIDRQLVHIRNLLTQGGHVHAVAVCGLGFGNIVDAVVARHAAVGRDHRVAGDLQHLHLARLVVEMDVEDHIGVAVIDACIIEVVALLLGRAVDADHQEVQLLALEFLRRVDELIQLDAAACRGD